VPLVTALVNSFLKGKARLRVAQPHGFTFLVQQPLVDQQGNQVSPNQSAHTRSFLVQNSGREPATKVELVFNWKPMCLNIWPSRHMTEHVEPDNRYVVILDSLSPGEVVGFEVLSVNQDLPDLVTVRSDQAVAQPINMYPQPVTSKGVRLVAGILMAVGLATTVYSAILLLQFLILKTPFGR